MRLKGKNAIVTGAGRGIGRAIAEAFAREGCRVVVGDIDGDAASAVAIAIQADGGQALARVIDVSARPDVQAMVKEEVERFGRLDVMVNNAGVRRQGWQQMIDVNLSGVAYGIRYAARAMMEQGGGSIINTASIGGLLGLGFPMDTGTDSYVATKHAVVGLTREFALSYGAYGVRINCVCPGNIDTEMMKDVMENEAVRRRLMEKSPLKRVGRPSEVAGAFVFLASDESSYITGIALPVDGGLSAGIGGGLTATE